MQQEVIRQGLTITAIHNHFVRNQPNVMYMHIGGMGDAAALASKVKAVFDRVQASRGGNPADGSNTEVENSLDTAMISRILGHPGEMNRGVYKVTIGRPDVDLREHGAPVSYICGLQYLGKLAGYTRKSRRSRRFHDAGQLSGTGDQSTCRK